jgi:bacterioferritin-associated ferredoxin
MYVCNCAGVTHGALHSRLQQGAANIKELRAELGLCTGCGKCVREVCEMLKALGMRSRTRWQACRPEQPVRPSQHEGSEEPQCKATHESYSI